MNKHLAIGIAAAALTIGVGTSTGVTGYMIGHHNGAATHTAEWRIDPADIERAVDAYLHQQQWEATKRQAMQSDVSASDNLLTPRRPIARNAAGDGSDWRKDAHLHRDLTKQQTYMGGN